ncbi:MAG TPA: PTS sugar transporter subunit IIA [Thermoanaerobaculia bacterium]|nr:PTS sugar transporter subunit IIA [Thermoanaerobaculia bacterium]
MKLTVRDAADLLGVSEKTIYRWIQGGSIPAYKISDQYRFNRAELLEWATSQRLNVSPRILEEPESERTPLPGLAEALQRGGVHYRVSGQTKEATLRSVVALLPLPDEVDRAFLLNVLLAREALGSTGIGDGIAIPHVRNPIVLHVEQPIVSLCYLEDKVDYGAIDGKPVRILFTLVTPTVRAHLHLLSRLAYLLRQPRFHDAVEAEERRETIQALAREIEASIPVTR